MEQLKTRPRKRHRIEEREVKQAVWLEAELYLCHDSSNRGTPASVLCFTSYKTPNSPFISPIPSGELNNGVQNGSERLQVRFCSSVGAATPAAHERTGQEVEEAMG